MDASGAVHSVPGGSVVVVGWNIRFNRAFDPGRYVLRPDTGTSVASFAAEKGDLHGSVAPNDNHVGYFRTTLQVPPGTTTASYLVRWTAIDAATGQSARLQPSLTLVVSPAQIVGPYDEVVVPTSGTRRVKVFAVNRSDRMWKRGEDNLHFVDPNGSDLRYPYCGSTPEWVNGTAVLMDEQTVAPGHLATYSVRVCGAPGYQGSATLRLQYVHEALAHASAIFPLHLRFAPTGSAPESYPLPAPQDGGAAFFMRPSEEFFIPSGGSASVPVWVKNLTARTWHRGKDNLHFVDPNGSDLRYPYCGSTPEWVNGNAVFMAQQQVAPGETAIYPVKICGAPNYQGTAIVRLQFIEEGVAHNPPIFPLRLRFGPPAPATFLGPSGENPDQEVIVRSGGIRLVDVPVRNDSGRTWRRGEDDLHFVDDNGNDLTYPYCGATPAWINGNAVLLTKKRVRRGKVGHFRLKICGGPGYAGPAILRLQYVREEVAHYPPIVPVHLRFVP